MKTEFEKLRRWVQEQEELENHEATLAGLAVLEVALTDLARIADAAERLAKATEDTAARYLEGTVHVDRTLYDRLMRGDQ